MELSRLTAGDQLTERQRQRLRAGLRYDRTGLSVEKLEEQAADGRLFFLEVDAKVTLAIERYPDCLHIVSMGGEGFCGWAAVLNEALKRLAIELDVPKVSMFGRRGWRRKLRRWGWREAFTVMELQVF